MSNAMMNFLVDVGTDAELKIAFQNQPEETMKSAGLNNEEIQLVYNDNVVEIKKRFGTEPCVLGTLFVNVVRK